MSQRNERSERSTQALLDAAAELVADGGTQALTFVAIAERSGYSRGLVSVRFGSKTGLLEALVVYLFRYLDQASHTGVAAPTGFERLSNSMRSFGVLAEENPVQLRALVVLTFESMAGDKELGNLLGHGEAILRRQIRSSIRDGIEDGSIRADIDPPTGADMVLALLEGSAFQWLRDRSTDLKRQMDAAVDVVERCYGASTSVPTIDLSGSEVDH